MNGLDFPAVSPVIFTIGPLAVRWYLGVKMTGLAFPDVSPVMFSIGGFAVRWYSMAYLAGIVLAWAWLLRDVKKYRLDFDKSAIEDVVFYVTIGIIAGGRLGYALFYGGSAFWREPWQILAIWHGGMSFHGGAVGAVFGLWYAAYKHKLDFWQLTDMAALYAPIGLFLGRLANFVNDELWGRVSEVPWAVRFPSGGYLPRHPSQLYEAFCEGLLMLLILNCLWRFCPVVRKRKGTVSALFVVLYAVFRIVLENFRQPDAQLGFYFGFITMGQMLSLPLLVFGGWLFRRRFVKPEK